MIFSICFSFTISSFADCNPYSDGICVSVDHGVFFYDGTNITQLTEHGPYDGPLGNDWPPQINDSGEVVWSRSETVGVIDDEIFIYDGTNIIQLTNNEYDDVYPQINNSGEVVWYAGDFVPSSDKVRRGGGGGGGGG